MRFSAKFLSEGLKKRRDAGGPSKVSQKKPRRAAPEDSLPSEADPSSSPGVTVVGGSNRGEPNSEKLVTEAPPGEVQEEPPAGIPASRPREEPTGETVAPTPHPIDEGAQEEETAAPSVPEADEDRSSEGRPPEGTEAPFEEDLFSRPSGINAMRRGRLAERLISRSALPNVQAELRRQPLEKSLETLFTAILQASNSALVLRDVCIAGRQKQNSPELDALRTQLGEVSRRLSEAESRESANSDALRTSEKENQVLRAQLMEVESRAQSAEVKLAEAVTRGADAEERAAASEEKAELFEFEARAAEEKLINIEERLASSEGKLASAEKEVRDALHKSLLAEAQAEEKVRAAQTAALFRVNAADQRAQKAIEFYKNSAEFAAECSEAAIDAYATGFRKCKKKILRIYRLGNLDHIQPTDEDSEDESASS